VTDYVSYEQPLNERMRTFLRIEQLMQRFEYCSSDESEWDTHCALVTLIEIFSLSTRGDLKSELMKELDRQISNLTRLQAEPDVDQTRLAEVIEQEQALISRLHDMHGQLGQHLKDNDFLNSIRQRTSIPGGTCDFDLPAYHFWLTRPAASRKAMLESWIEPFQQIQEAVGLILHHVRDGTEPTSQTAQRGFVQQSLEMGVPYQIIRVELPLDAPYYPEISAGRHRFSIRFLRQHDLSVRAQQCEQDIEFRLAKCAL
jgi:cell division protein ZapD